VVLPRKSAFAEHTAFSRTDRGGISSALSRTKNRRLLFMLVDGVAFTLSCFHRRGYVALVDTAREVGYRFASFDDPALDEGGRVCLLRHDVDADVGRAAELARIESERGIRATYFFMLRSPLYNLLGRANQRLAQEILELGHWLGLHYDVGFAPAEGRRHEDEIALEADFLEKMLGHRVRAVSFHQPAFGLVDPASLQLTRPISAWNFPNFQYFSDANRSPQTELLYDILREGPYERIQLLIHPLWWACEGTAETTEDLWERAIVENFERSQEQILETERAFGAPRTMRIERAPAAHAHPRR
jgi:hypothetical protein